MKKLTTFGALVVLSACATPQQKCINEVSSEYNELVAKIELLDGDLARGYAIHSKEVPYDYKTTCVRESVCATTYDRGQSTSQDSQTVTLEEYDCVETRYRTEETSVPINISETRKTLGILTRNLPAVRAQKDQAVNQCIQQFPK